MTHQNYLNQDLTGTDFSGQDLTGTLFRGANLTNCNFTGAILDYANMREANIEGADFTNAQFHYANIKDAVGSATWLNARVRMAPKWVNFIGADDVTEPPTNVDADDRQTLISELMNQASVTYNDLSTADKALHDSFIATGYKVVFTGSYGDMPNGKNVYVVIDFATSPLQDFSIVANEHIEQETMFDIGSDKYAI